jgi:hypothetical protein
MSGSVAKYSSANRLADVLALIQSLAFEREARWSEDELREELGAPRSASAWTTICAEHPEFFRVRAADPKEPESTAPNRHRLALLSRVMLPSGRRDLPVEFVNALMQTAIDLHDREATRFDRRWLWIALIGALATIAAALLRLAFGGP